MPNQSTKRCLLPHLCTNNDRLYQQMNNVMQAVYNKNAESAAAENTSFIPFSSFSAWTLPPPLILRWSLLFQRYLFSQNPYNEQGPGTEVASTMKKKCMKTEHKGKQIKRSSKEDSHHESSVNLPIRWGKTASNANIGGVPGHFIVTNRNITC